MYIYKVEKYYNLLLQFVIVKNINFGNFNFATYDIK